MATYLDNLTRGSAMISLNLPRSVLLGVWMKKLFIRTRPC